MNLYSTIPVVVATVAFLVIFFIAVGIAYWINAYAQKQKMLAKIQEGYGKEDKVIDTNGTSTIKFTISRILQRMGKRILQDETETYSDTKLMFLRAGFQSQNVAYAFWGVKAYLMVFLPIVFIVSLKLLPPLSLLIKVICIIYLAAFGFYLPNIWLRLHTSRRKNKIRKSMPDALDLLVVCVESGMGLDSAISKVGEEIKLSSRELSDEFKLLSNEIRMGKSRTEALKNLALRTDIDEIRTLATILIQTERFGTSIARALRTVSDGSRVQRFQRAEELANKMSVKLSFPLIFFIFPALFVVILGPAIIRVIRMFTQMHN